jgi:O-acetyl-ADP-ribose deacetylase (regulator of RNase III)
MNERIEIIKGDITKLQVDAIVNAANHTLLGGGGVDGAIHRAAGSGLYLECRSLNGCETGKAKITKGYSLPAKFVIHAVGPVWHGGNNREPELLASCYLSSLALADKYKLKTIAFPNISTGIYGFPKPLAAEIAVYAVRHFLLNNFFPEKVFFCCFDNENFEIYNTLINPNN